MAASSPPGDDLRVVVKTLDKLETLACSDGASRNDVSLCSQPGVDRGTEGAR